MVLTPISEIRTSNLGFPDTQHFRLSTDFDVFLHPPWDCSSHALSSYIASANRLALSSIGTKGAADFISSLFSSRIGADARGGVAVYASHLRWTDISVEDTLNAVDVWNI